MADRLAELIRVLLDGLASGLEVELLEVRVRRGGRVRLELHVHAPPRGAWGLTPADRPTRAPPPERPAAPA